MDEKIFVEMMLLLNKFYGEKFKVSKDILDAWYECLNDLDDEKTFKTAVVAWTKDHKYPPTIAELREQYVREGMEFDANGQLIKKVKWQ